MPTPPRLAAALVLSSILCPACVYDTEDAGAVPTVQPPAFERDDLLPDRTAWDELTGSGGPQPAPTDPAVDPDALERPLDFQAAVRSGRDTRELVRQIVVDTVEQPRTTPHEVRAEVDTRRFRGTLRSESDGTVRVARLLVEGWLRGRRVTLDVAWSDWGNGQLLDGTLSHRDTTVDLYEILQLDADGTIRFGLENTWILGDVRYDLREGSIVIAPSETDDPGERTVTAEGDLLRDGEIVGGLVADDGRAVLEGPEGEVAYVEL